MLTRTSYDTAIKHLYRKGLEESIPQSLRKSIPRNTIHRWRLQDIRFGNVQIEAHNKILKQSWLYRREIATLEKLKQEVKAFVREFNTVRPHHAIGGLTPNEKHYEVEPYENYHYRKEQSEALKARIIGNKQNACGTCIGPKLGKCTF